MPVLTNDFINAPSDSTREAIKIIFKSVHQFGGVLLGEHLGQLFTILWTILIAYAFSKLRLFPGWIIWLGYISAAIYLLAQAELFATVIPGFPVWDLAGLIGSTMWLVWLVIVGIKLLRVEIK